MTDQKNKHYKEYIRVLEIELQEKDKLILRIKDYYKNYIKNPIMDIIHIPNPFIIKMTDQKNKHYKEYIRVLEIELEEKDKFILRIKDYYKNYIKKYLECIN